MSQFKPFKKRICSIHNKKGFYISENCAIIQINHIWHSNWVNPINNGTHFDDIFSKTSRLFCLINEFPNFVFIESNKLCTAKSKIRLIVEPTTIQ